MSMSIQEILLTKKQPLVLSMDFNGGGCETSCYEVAATAVNFLRAGGERVNVLVSHVEGDDETEVLLHVFKLAIDSLSTDEFDTDHDDNTLDILGIMVTFTPASKGEKDK